MDALRVQSFTVGQLEQRTQDFAANLGRARIACHTESVSTAGDFYIETAFDLSQVLIKLSAKIG